MVRLAFELFHLIIRLFHQSPLTFDQAERACNAYKVNDCSGAVLSKGHLVSVHSQAEQDILVRLVKETLAAQVSSISIDLSLIYGPREFRNAILFFSTSVRVPRGYF